MATIVFQKLVLGVFLSLLAGSGLAAERQCAALYIQLFATSVPAKANTMETTLNKAGFKAVITSFQHNGKTLFRVRTGPYSNRNMAVETQQRMKIALKGNVNAQNSIIANGSAACDVVFPKAKPQVSTPPNHTSTRFLDYKAPALYKGKHHALVMNEFSSMFRTRLQVALDGEKPTFAGQYIVTGWGCGSNCYTGAVINAKTGVATPFPVTLSSVFPLKPEFANEDGLEHIYRIDSRLMVFAGHLGGSAKGDGIDTMEFYEFRDGKFILIESRPYGRSTSN